MKENKWNTVWHTEKKVMETVIIAFTKVPTIEGAVHGQIRLTSPAVHPVTHPS